MKRRGIFIGGLIILLLILAIIFLLFNSGFSGFNARAVFSPATCSDSDGGRNYYVNGTVTTKSLGVTKTYRDVCINSTTLRERYCVIRKSDSILDNKIYFCENGCVNGACNICPLNQIFHQGFCKPKIINLDLSYNFSEIQNYGRGDGGIFDSELFAFNYAPLVNKARELILNKTLTYDKVYSISNYVYNSKIYANNYNVPIDSIPAYWDVDRGKCFHAAQLTQAMLNMIGIPALHYDVFSVAHAQTLVKIGSMWGVIDTTFFKSSLEQPDINITIPSIIEMKNKSMFITGDYKGMYSSQERGFCNLDDSLCLNNTFYMLRIMINPAYEKNILTLPLIKNFYLEDINHFNRRYYGCLLTTPYNCVGGCTENELKPEYNVKIGKEWGIKESGTYNLFKHDKETSYDSPSLQGEGTYQFIGYATMPLPKNNLRYNYTCYRLDPSQWSSEDPADFHEVAYYFFNMSSNVKIKWNNIKKSGTATPEEFNDVINYIKSTTDDLGIYP